ncbi:MAG: pacearchaeosortase [Nanoarchaeota archaeon]
MERIEALSLAFRYGLLFVIGVANLLLGDSGLFYVLFTQITIGPVFYFLNIIYEGVTIFGADTVFIGGYYATIIPACVAGSAYYLLLILNMTTPMSVKKRISCLLFVFALFLVMNIARIVLFGTLLSKGYQYFDVAHLAMWYFGSTILVAVIWFSAIFLFKIKEAPVFTDMQRIVRDVRHRGHA